MESSRSGGRFGRYLRQLREQRRLTLDQVEELSIPYRVRLSKAFLSRCENGITEPSIERLVVLSKIYRTSFGALAERMVAESELDESGPLDASSLTSEELRLKGNEALQHGDLKVAFTCYREAEMKAAAAEKTATAGVTPRDGEADLDAGTQPGSRATEDAAKARLSMAVALQRMGRYQLARDEAERALALTPEESLDRYSCLMVMAICHYRLGNLPIAEIYLSVLQTQSESLPEKDQADILLLTGNVQYVKKQFRQAVASYRKAALLYRSCKDLIGQSRALKNAANSYGKMGEYDRAVRQARRALELSRRVDDKQEIAMDWLSLGTWQYHAGDTTSSRASLYAAIELARRGDYHDTLFAANFYLWKMARAAGDRIAPSLERSLRHLLTKLDEALEEAAEFRRLTGETHDA